MTAYPLGELRGDFITFLGHGGRVRLFIADPNFSVEDNELASVVRRSLRGNVLFLPGRSGRGLEVVSASPSAYYFSYQGDKPMANFNDSSGESIASFMTMVAEEAAVDFPIAEEQ